MISMWKMPGRALVFLSRRPFEDGESRPRLALHWSMWPRDLWRFRLEFTVGGEDRGVSVTAILLCLYLSVGIKRILPRRFAHWYRARAQAWAKESGKRWWAYQLDIDGHGRSTFIEVDGSFRIGLWRGIDWSRQDRTRAPWKTNGWEWRLPWFDLLFGRSRYEESGGQSYDVPTDIDGVMYPLRVRIYSCRWNRRWPWRGRWYSRFDVSLPESVSPPKFAGKGENSWDCGDDAIYSLTGSVRRQPWTPDEAVGEYVRSYRQSLERYGRARGAA